MRRCFNVSEVKAKGVVLTLAGIDREPSGLTLLVGVRIATGCTVGDLAAGGRREFSFTVARRPVTLPPLDLRALTVGGLRERET